MSGEEIGESAPAGRGRWAGRLRATGRRPWAARGAIRSSVARWRSRGQDLHSALRNLPRALRLVWEAHRLSTIGMAVLTLVAAAVPATQAWAGKLIVDTVVPRSTRTSRPPWGCAPPCRICCSSSACL